MNKPTTFKNSQWAVTADGDLVSEGHNVIIDHEYVSPGLDRDLESTHDWFDKILFKQAFDVAMKQ